jgi:hypothetical protein
MKFASWLGTLALLSSAAAGCGDDAPGDLPADDAGSSRTPRDAGDARDSDGPLVWRPPDAGRDSGGGTTPTRDAGANAGRACAQPREAVPAFLLPRCGAQTRDCMATCPAAADPGDCRDACLAADTTPPDPSYPINCAACVYLQLFACIDRTECHDAVADAFCCFADRCPTGSPEGCNEQRCPTELSTAVTCGYYADMACLDFLGGMVGQCFPGDSADADAGTQ